MLNLKCRNMTELQMHFKYTRGTDWILWLRWASQNEGYYLHTISSEALGWSNRQWSSLTHSHLSQALQSVGNLGLQLGHGKEQWMTPLHPIILCSVASVKDFLDKLIDIDHDNGESPWWLATNITATYYHDDRPRETINYKDCLLKILNQGYHHELKP